MTFPHSISVFGSVSSTSTLSYKKRYSQSVELCIESPYARLAAVLVLQES